MDILDIFYNQIIKEAANGRVDCYFYYNILFNTYLVETDKRITGENKYEDVIVPTLTIKNKKLFDELLKKYVSLCLEFYDNTNYPEEIINGDYANKEKVIMTLLWSNATYDDFADPILFLHKRIAFLESKVGEISHEFEFSPTLNGNISLSVEKDTIYNETPYKIVIKVTSKDGIVFEFPEIKFGIFADTLYFYAIQNKGNEKNDYSKKVNRTLFKIGEGFDASLDNAEIYEEGNLKDISASFLVALNMAISYLHSLGYEKLCISSILISRWNAKKIALQNQISRNKVKPDDVTSILDSQEAIQKNLTEKFLRTFLRLAHHYPNISIDSMPFEMDSNLHLSISGNELSNNELLNETASIVKLSSQNKII